MPKVFDFSFFHVSDEDAVIMEFLLSLLEKQTVSECKVTNSEFCDIAIINIDKVAGKALYDKLIKQPDGPYTIAYTDDISKSDADFKLPSPLRSAEFLAVCKEVIEKNPELGTTSKILTEPAPDPVQPVQTEALPVRNNVTVLIKRPTEKRLINLLHEDQKQYTKPIKVSSSEISLYIDFINQVFYCEHKIIQLSMLCKTDINNLKIEEIPPSYMTVFIDTFPTHPLSELIWYSALLGSAGELTESLNEKSILHLTRWPKLVSQMQLPKHIRHSHVKITAFMTKNSATINEIVAKTQVPAETLINFINACRFLNYIYDKKPVESAKSTAINNEASRKGIFGKLRNKFGTMTAQ